MIFKEKNPDKSCCAQRKTWWPWNCPKWPFSRSFTGWIVFFWSYLHWLDRLLILPSLAGSSSSDFTFTGWILFWSNLHWLDRLLLILPLLDRLLILPLLVGSSSDLVFTGCIFFWFWFYWLRSKFFGLVIKWDIIPFFTYIRSTDRTDMNPCF